MTKELEMVLKSGKINCGSDAAIFEENADFYDLEDGRGYFRIETKNVCAETDGHCEKFFEDEVIPTVECPQDIRFYDKDMNQIENPFMD